MQTRRNRPGLSGESCHDEAQEADEGDEVDEVEDLADGGEAGEGVGLVGEEGGEGAGGHVDGEPGPGDAEGAGGEGWGRGDFFGAESVDAGCGIVCFEVVVVPLVMIVVVVVVVTRPGGGYGLLVVVGTRCAVVVGLDAVMLKMVAVPRRGFVPGCRGGVCHCDETQLETVYLFELCAQ